MVLSVVWAIGAAVHTRNASVDSAENAAKFAYNTCIYGKEVHHEIDLSSCDAERTASLKTWMAGSKTNATFVALGPLPLAWLAIFILIHVTRAQIAGFRAVIPWKTLVPFKKAFVVFCFISTFVSVGIGLVVLMNLYVDTKVPVGISPFFDVTGVGGDLATVAGTWTRTDLTDDTIATPLQTSKIECNKAENRCTEALASVSGNTLLTDLVDYDVQSWTSNAIVLRKDSSCATELFTIDLNTKAVSGAGHKTNGDDPFCKIFGGGDKETWTYEMASGFKPYWELRQKARPLPLRLFQSFFGN